LLARCSSTSAILKSSIFKNAKKSQLKRKRRKEKVFLEGLSMPPHLNLIDAKELKEFLMILDFKNTPKFF